MKCPNCNETLVMTERQGVEIDYCPKCRGVWLDKGELDKIIEKSQSGLAGTNPANRNFDQFEDQYEDDDNDNRRRSAQKRRRGFLGDLFDFD
jgi:Zn-finger nucleic acid-binding protein